jgi:hypothetical protein
MVSLLHIRREEKYYKTPGWKIGIRDPGFGAFSTPGSGKGKNLHSDPGVRIRDEHILDHISGSLLRNHFWVKILQFFYADSESGIFFLSLDPG